MQMKWSDSLVGSMLIYTKYKYACIAIGIPQVQIAICARGLVSSPLSHINLIHSFFP